MTRTTDEYGRQWAVDGSEHDPRARRAMDRRNANRLNTHHRVIARDYEGAMSDALREILVRLLGEVHRLMGVER
ncbi:MAG: hypothetical protein GY851_09310 [bacterium]|nr:hypothetical protein [bacterium]